MGKTTSLDRTKTSTREHDPSRHGGKPIPAGTTTAFSLYDPGAVALATLFGSPVAGSVLMALNFVRLGKPFRAAAVVTLGLALSAMVFGVGTAGTGLILKAAVPALLAMVCCAKAFQGAQVKEHVRLGGKLGSRWTALSVGLASLVVIVAGTLILE